MSTSEQLVVATMAIKVADLSYLSKRQSHSLLWTERCLEEFFLQGDEEKELELPVGTDRKQPRIQPSLYPCQGQSEIKSSPM